MGGRGLVRIPHAKVNDILTTTACVRFEILDLTKDVGREALNAKEGFHRAERRSCSDERGNHL